MSSGNDAIEKHLDNKFGDGTKAKGRQAGKAGAGEGKISTMGDASKKANEYTANAEEKRAGDVSTMNEKATKAAVDVDNI